MINQLIKLQTLIRMYKHWFCVSLLEGFKDVYQNYQMWRMFIKSPYTFKEEDFMGRKDLFYHWLSYESVSFQYWMDTIKNNKYLGE